MARTLVTGGTGMIGRYLVKRLIENGEDVVVASLDNEGLCPSGAMFRKLDLRYLENCIDVCKDIDTVYHLAGVKGSPKMCREKPASFFVPTIMFNTNMLEAARREGVKKFLLTSSVGVYSPAEIFNEDDVWKTFPSENDKYAGWAKRMGELQVDAYRTQYKECSYSIVRPGNVYGRHDNFDPNNAMVIPSLIKRLSEGEDPLIVWGDGKPIRDFVHADDVASAMIFCIENNIEEPVNIASGIPVSIKELVSMICESWGDASYKFNGEGVQGDNRRLMSMDKLKGYGWEPTTTLQEGISDTINWFKDNHLSESGRYNSFTEKV